MVLERVTLKSVTCFSVPPPDFQEHVLRTELQ